LIFYKEELNGKEWMLVIELLSARKINDDGNFGEYIDHFLALQTIQLFLENCMEVFIIAICFYSGFKEVYSILFALPMILNTMYRLLKFSIKLIILFCSWFGGIFEDDRAPSNNNNNSGCMSVSNIYSQTSTVNENNITFRDNVVSKV
jgi:hypothetical protein